MPESLPHSRASKASVSKAKAGNALRCAVLPQVLAAVIPRRTREQLMLFTRKQRAEAAEALLQVGGWGGAASA